MAPSFFGRGPRFEGESQSVKNQEALASVNEALLKLDNLSALQLQTPEGRKVLSEQIDLIFAYVENIEEAGEEVEPMVHVAIEKRMREIHAKLRATEFKGVPNSVESNYFHRDLLDIADKIERGVGGRYLDSIISDHEQQAA